MTTATPRASKWRPDDDHYNTPVDAIIPFIRGFLRRSTFVRRRFKDRLPIWEPACGEGAMSKVLLAHGCDVESTTLMDRGYGETGTDFFGEKRLRKRIIMTNPPFTCIDEFVLKALAFDPDVLAIFARSKFKEGAERFRTIHSRQPYTIEYQFIERIVFFAGDMPLEDQPGWNTEAFSWFVWLKGNTAEPITRWLSKRDGSHPDLFETKARGKREPKQKIIQTPPATPALLAAMGEA
jgi:hypothetical protein